MMDNKSLDSIFHGFEIPEEGTKIQDKFAIKGCVPITLWLPASAKERYDKLQKLSGNKFGKKAKELLLAAIEMTDAKAG